MKLIKPVFGILFLLAFSLAGFGQQPVPGPIRRYRPVYVRPYQPGARLRPVNPGRNPGIRVEQVKENFIARQLNLNPQQSRSFWPLYRQYIQEQTAVRIAKQQNLLRGSPGDPQQAERELEYESELVDIRRRYLQEFMRILPPEKVNVLYKSERQFNDEMVRQLSERSGIRAGN